MPQELPTVSIVIPAYNHARFLATAIDSVLSQDYPHVELMVLNDGSTDETERVLSEYPPERFYRETHANMGQSATLNKGWRMSRGAIVSYLSADDVLKPGAVRQAVEFLQTHAQVVLTYCDFDLLSPTGQVVRRIRARDFHYREMLEQGVCHPGPGVFFRRAALEQAGPWSRHFRQMPDYDFWLRLGLLGPFQRIPRSLAGFRVHPQSQTYAPASVKTSGEPVRIMSRFFRRTDLPPWVLQTKSRALSNSHLISAQLHWRSGRYAAGLRMAARACALDPQILAAPHTGRVVLHAMFGRLRHTLLCRLHACLAHSGSAPPGNR